jgi:2-C-methyl-D-erythritol 4-phosphate cytidylyltransferase
MWALVPAAGSGQRYGGDIAKQYLPLAGSVVIVHALRALMAHPSIDGVMVALAADDLFFSTLHLPQGKPILTCPGGLERADSVLNALAALPSHVADDDYVAVHDAARPCVTKAALSSLFTAAAADAVGAILAERIVDTVKLADAHGRIAKSLDRQLLWRAQTPQVFRRFALTQALRLAKSAKISITDEAMAMELQGQYATLVPGERENLKITLPADLLIAEQILCARP